MLLKKKTTRRYHIGIHGSVRTAWSRYYVEALKNHCEIKQSISILDYGCGFFDIGKMMLDKAGRVDGFDTAGERIRLLQQIHKDKPNACFFSDRETIPDRHYDVIIINSVIQYFKSNQEITDTLNFLKHKLKGKESLIIISDIIPKNYSSLKDSFFLLGFSFKNKILVEIFNEFFRAFLSGNHHSFLKLDYEDLKRICKTIGLSIRRLEKNLTPSGYRYTCILTTG